MLAAVRQNGCALRYASKALRADREVALAAVKQDGHALSFVSEALNADRGVVLAAVKQNGGALWYAPVALRAEREVVLAAVKQNGGARAVRSMQQVPWRSCGCVGAAENAQRPRRPPQRSPARRAARHAARHDTGARSDRVGIALRGLIGTGGSVVATPTRLPE